MTPEESTRLVLPTLPGVEPVLPQRLHFVAAIAAVVVGVLSAGVAATSSPLAGVAAWLQVVAALVAAAVAVSLVIEHVRFLRSGWPSIPPDAVVVAPRPEVRVRPSWRGTPRGLRRRARLWADGDSVGIVTWLHRESRWTRDQVSVLRAVRGPQGDLTFLELLGPHGQVLGWLHWWDWFEDGDDRRLREFADRAGLELVEVPWNRARGPAARSMDEAENYPRHAARFRGIPHMAHAAGLGIVALLCAIQSGRTPGGPGPLGTAVGFGNVAACLALMVATVAVGWWDQTVVRGKGRNE
ncbi:hypothetical protein [Cellulomonas hominis]